MFKTNLDLIDLHRKYEAFVDDLKVEPLFLKLLETKDLTERKQIWDQLLQLDLPKSELKKLANPFYIGYGNPDAEVLFLGKEKGFNIEGEHDLLLKESVNNILQWQEIGKEVGREGLDFYPKNPRSSFPKMRKHQTWGTYANLLARLTGNEKLYFPDCFSIQAVGKDSFFSKCFLTELNYQPSKYSKGDPSAHEGFQKRKEFLRDWILPNFKIIIIGASTYFDTKNHLGDTKPSNLEKQLNELFGEVIECKDAIYEDRFINTFWHFQTIDKSKNIFLTSQLSSINRWNDFKLSAFAKRINATCQKQK